MTLGCTFPCCKAVEGPCTDYPRSPLISCSTSLYWYLNAACRPPLFTVVHANSSTLPSYQHTWKSHGSQYYCVTSVRPDVEHLHVWSVSKWVYLVSSCNGLFPCLENQSKPKPLSQIQYRYVAVSCQQTGRPGPACAGHQKCSHRTQSSSSSSKRPCAGIRTN